MLAAGYFNMLIVHFKTCGVRPACTFMVVAWSNAAIVSDGVAQQREACGGITESLKRAGRADPQPCPLAEY